MLEELKRRVFLANLELVKKGLVIYTWGNVSGIERERGLVVIKPSGVSYEEMTENDMVVVSLETGEAQEGNLRPSSDTPTHLEIYKAFPSVGGVVHTHSKWATVFSQAGEEIKPLGTTHADYFYGDVPVTRALGNTEIEKDYEKNTGLVIAERFKALDPEAIPSVLVKEHGPFSWGKTPEEAVFNAAVLERVAEMAFYTLKINPSASINPKILDKHYQRKHGKNAYYGQK